MKLTKKQNEELDSIKSRIEAIEKNMQNSREEIEFAVEVEDYKKARTLENSIEFGDMKIRNMVRIQSEAMKLEFNLVLDLIFDREYTLSIMD